MFFMLFVESTLQYSFAELFLVCFKIKFLSGSGIDFLLYRCNLFVGVVIKVCLLGTYFQKRMHCCTSILKVRIKMSSVLGRMYDAIVVL